MVSQQSAGGGFKTVQCRDMSITIGVVIVGVHHCLALQPLGGDAAVVLQGDRHQYQVTKPGGVICAAHLHTEYAAHHAAHGVWAAGIAQHHVMSGGKRQLRHGTPDKTCSNHANLHVLAPVEV